MAINGSVRKTATIMVADLVGYSRLMGEDEGRTLASLRRHRREFIDPLINEYRGRIVKTMGDGLLIEFSSAIDAVRCAIAWQEGMVTRDMQTPEKHRMVFRLGINLSEVLIEDGDLFGDGVNIAARLEGMAQPGGILISQSVRDSMEGEVSSIFVDNGERKFKNIVRPIRVWSWPQPLPTLRAEGKPRIFVADIEGLSEKAAHVATELGDELRAHLGRLTGLELTAERGDAHYTVEGSVRLATGKARVYGRLIAVDRSQQIWSDRYDEYTDDPFDILDNCVPRMAMSIRRRVAADDAERIAGRKMDELSLEELLASAGVSFFTPTKDGWRRGGEMAEHALELAPENFMALAMAAAGLGLVEYLYGFSKPDDAAINLALKRVNAALRLTNLSDMLHATHSALLLFGHRHHHEAAAAARRALELNSDYNMGMWLLGATQVFAGDCDTGTETATRAVNIDIRDPYVHLYSRIVAYGHLCAGRADEATEWFLKADALAPGVAPNLIGLTVAYHLAGDGHGASNAVARLMEEEPGFRLGSMHPLPFSDNAIWAHFVDALRMAGTPE